MGTLIAISTFVLVSIVPSAAQPPPAPALRIVIIEGEGAVNILQQKTAVRPLIEVRDRNNLPVAGASVTFTVSGGGQSAAFAGGAQTLTVTTNAAGRAAASGLNALSSGAVQIQVQAAYQGQIASAAISQTNVATAAAATQAGASASGAGGSGSGASGAAGGTAGGGGVSGTTLGIVGAAVGGGALAAAQVAGKSDEGDERDTGPELDQYEGTLSGQISVNSQFTAPQGPGSSCTFTRSVSGTIRIELAAGNATGRATLAVTQTDIAVTSQCTLSTQPVSYTLLPDSTQVSGGPSALTFSGTVPIGSETHSAAFSGSHSGNTISGTVTLSLVSPPGGNPARNGSTTLTVTLQRR